VSTAKKKVSFATVWLDGCSGCHMSFLDIDHRLLDLAESIELVYSPLVDHKDYPDQVDVCLVEGSVSNTDDLKKITKIRAHTTTLIALGDCAVHGNIPSMRNRFNSSRVLDRAFQENVTKQPGIPYDNVPALLDTVRPVHEVVPVDVHIPGCPPPADAIFEILSDLLNGETTDVNRHTRFGK
jgi:NAD-reducing hydrogenase small subunit